jgi:hypothetical protein
MKYKTNQMKTRLVFPVLLIVSFSCGINNKPLSDTRKEKIKGEVKEVVNTIVKGAEEVNFEIVAEQFMDTPDFVFLYDGRTFSYEDCTTAFKSLFSKQTSQKHTILNEKYAIIDESTVLYTNNLLGETNFKDGHTILQDPWTMQFLFRKIDDKWKVIGGSESGIEKTVMKGPI